MEINRTSTVSHLSWTRPYAPAEAESPSLAAGDRFQSSGGAGSAGDRFQSSAGVYSAADRAADAALLHHCGDGCGCCRTAAGGDPIQALEARDREVREHENCHLVAAGEWAVGAPQYTFVTARNGHAYAVGGRVHVDISEIAGRPLKTIEKMRQILKSCLAPDEPSAQDRHVAAVASARIAEAQARLRTHQKPGSSGTRMDPCG